MEIDSAVEFVLLIVELHIMSFLERVCLSHETSEDTPSILIFKALTLMDGSTRSSWDMMSIKSLNMTANYFVTFSDLHPAAC